tara:strand:- start:780 stop:1103 length:324 start_codon:yes stop_codon:yes gene_type:complete
MLDLNTKYKKVKVKKNFLIIHYHINNLLGNTDAIGQQKGKIAINLINIESLEKEILIEKKNKNSNKNKITKTRTLIRKIRIENAWYQDWIRELQDECKEIKNILKKL